MHRTAPLIVLTLSLAATIACAESRSVAYEIDGQTYVGYLAEPADVEGKAPGVLVVHEWWGLNDYAKRRADMLADLGYVAFAVDMYGDGRTTDNPAEAAQWAGALYGQPAMRQRAKAGMDVLRQQDSVDADRVAAIGYCFGGTTVQQLAFAGPGEHLRGVVSFHGNVAMPSDDDLERTTAGILLLHGGADAMVPMPSVVQWQQRLEAAGIDYQIVVYPSATHSFTSPEADERNIPGIAYDAKADRRSWQDMQQFFDELFE